MKPYVIIDAGHGGKDPGGGSNHLWREKDLALHISRYQYERCLDLGIAAAMTRQGDETLDPETRARIVRNSGAKICLCNHINAGGGDGFEAIHSLYSDGRLASLCAEEIGRTGQNVRRVYARSSPGNRKRDYYFMHRQTGNVQTVILEYGFADSTQDDVAQLSTSWPVYAEAVIRALCRYMQYRYIAK
jgi:N-acetylmuramoyl-L-alanine amidase